jgi:hypothetical protein
MDNTSSRFTDNTSSRFTDNTSSRFTDNTSSRFSTHKNQQQILGGKNPRSWKTKIIHQSLQLHNSLICLYCATIYTRNQFWWCVCVCVFFFLLNFLFKLYSIYLFTFLFKICLFILIPVMCNIFPKRGNATFEIE